MLNFLSDLFVSGEAAEPMAKMDHMSVLATEDNVITFDYTLAQVDAES